jgi:hypothetical protein
MAICTWYLPAHFPEKLMEVHGFGNLNAFWLLGRGEQMVQ